MNVSGLAILTRKMLVTRRYGSDAWGQFFGGLARTHGCFRSLVAADTPIPLPAFLAFHDELMRRFFSEDPSAYVKLGREASRFAVRDGPLKNLVGSNDLGTVVAALPQFHREYFKEASTWSEAELTPDGVEFKVFDLPEWHPYFEHLVVGYISEILELVCANPIHSVRLAGGAGKHYHYLLHGAPSADGDSTLKAKSRDADGIEVLSQRELEVLLLVARGRTNEEIGGVLGISKKTAQHHVAHAYRKLGVSNRVTATLWLMERGLL